MLALGIDTSSTAGSVGLVEDARLVAELNVRAGNTHSERLLASVQSLLETTGVKAAQIDLFAVAAGPGSFTGLRIGMATAKGLALGVGRPVVGFSTLETIAMALAPGMPSGIGACDTVCIMLDAGRGEVYRGLFRFEGDRVVPMLDEAALPPEAAVEGLPDGCVLCGDGVAAYGDRIVRRAGPRAVIPSIPFIGLTLARRAIALAAERGLDRLPPLIPSYLRISDAEMNFKG